MTSVTVFILISLYHIQLSTSQLSSPTVIGAPLSETNETTTNDILSFGIEVTNTITQKVATLPASMKVAGDSLVADTKEGLQSCESAFNRGGTAWEYKVCCTSYLKYGMTEFGRLAEEGYRSGAESNFKFLLTVVLLVMGYLL